MSDAENIVEKPPEQAAPPGLKPVKDPELLKKLESAPPAAPDGKPVSDAELIKKIESAPPGPVSEQLRARIAGPLGRKAAASVRQSAKQMDPEIDYSGVNTPKLRAQYAFLDTPEERQSFLKKHFGEKNVTQDSFGRDVVIMNGQKVSFLPRGGRDEGKPGAAAASWADASGEVLPVAGMVLGSLATAPLPVAWPASVVGSGVGAAGGRGLNKLIKGVMGENKQDTGEIVKDMALEVPKGAAAQGVGEVLGLAARSIARGPYREDSIFGPITARGKELFKKAQDEVRAAREIGLRPKVGTYSPNAAFTQRVQNAGFRLFGDDLSLMNRPIIEKKAGELTGGAIKNTAAGTETVNRGINARADQIVKTYAAVADAAKADAEALLKGAEEHITTSVGEPSGELAYKVANDIQTAKTAFTVKAAEMYGPVDAIAGEPVVPTETLKSVMKQILEEGPQTTKGEPVFATEAIKKFASDIMSLPENVTFQQMQVARSTLRDYSAIQALNVGLSERQAARLAMAADDTFNDAAETVITKRTLGAEPPPPMKPFQGETLLQAIRKKGGIDIKEIADVTGEGRVGAGRRGLPPNTFTKNGKDLGDLAQQLKDEGWNVPDDVDGGVQFLRDAIRDELDGRPVYSMADTDRLTAWEMEGRAREAAAGQKPIEITETKVVPGVEEAKKALREADKFYRDGIQKFHDLTAVAMVKDATQTGFVEPERVAARLAVPGQNDKLLRIKELVAPSTFGEIGAAKWRQMLDMSQDALTGQVSGRTLARNLKKMGPSLETLYGKGEAGRMVAYAEQLAALNGNFDAAALGKERLSEVVRDAVMKKEASDAVMSRGFIKALQTDGPQSLNAVQWLTEPEHRLAMRQAIGAFGPKSKEVAEIKEFLARRIFSEMEVPATKGAERFMQTEYMGEPLQAALNRYDRPYLEEVFGKDWTDSAYKLAKNIEVAARKNPQDSGQLIAAAIGIHPIRNLAQIVRFFTAGELLSKNAVITYLSRGVDSKGLDFLQNALGKMTTGGIGYQVEKQSRQGADYARGAAIHSQSPLNSMIQSTGVKP